MLALDPAECSADKRRQCGLLSSTTSSLPTVPSAHHFVSCRVSEVCALFLPHPSFSLPLSLAYTTCCCLHLWRPRTRSAPHIWHAETIFWHAPLVLQHWLCNTTQPTVTVGSSQEGLPAEELEEEGQQQGLWCRVAASGHQSQQLTLPVICRWLCTGFLLSVAYNAGKNKM